MATSFSTGAQNDNHVSPLKWEGLRDRRSGVNHVLFFNKILPFWQDAMVVMLKSLMPGCFFNIVGFGSTYKSLFPTSQSYDEVTTPSPGCANYQKINILVNLFPLPSRKR